MPNRFSRGAQELDTEVKQEEYGTEEPQCTGESYQIMNAGRLARRPVKDGLSMSDSKGAGIPCIVANS